MTRESMEYDVVIVGGGPSGLAAAIRVKQLAAAGGRDVSVCLLEKGSEIGAHILSGAVIDPRGLTELLPDWKAEGAPLDTPVTEDRFLILTADKAYGIPNWALPRLMDNHGNFIASLGNLCKWLATRAESLGVEIYPGFAAAEVLYDEGGAVAGVATNDMGVAKDGAHRPDYQPGMELHAKYTLFAEGCRGTFAGGKRLAYGARAINEGGLQSVPKLAFPGGALIGCAAGFVNLPRIKGSHNAIKTGMLGAEAAYAAIAAGRAHDTLADYDRAWRDSWVYEDLWKVRNVKPGLKWGMWLGSLHGGVHMWANDLGLGKLLPWTLRHDKPDHESLTPASQATPVEYPKYDGVLTFDKLSSVFQSNTNHEEDQPSHLTLKDPAIPV